MLSSRDLHPISRITSLVVAASATLAPFSGGFLPNIHASLLDGLQLYAIFILLVVEALVIAVSVTLVVEKFVRQWKRSRQFGLSELFMLTTAVAIVLSLLATERRMAAHGGMPDDLPWQFSLLSMPTFFGFGCVVYSVAWGIEHVLHRLKDRGKAEGKR